MAATIEARGMTATVDGYQWSSSDERFAELLQYMLDPLGPSGSDPNPDYHAALAAVEALGGEVVSYDPTEYVEGRIY